MISTKYYSHSSSFSCAKNKLPRIGFFGDSENISCEEFQPVATQQLDIRVNTFVNQLVFEREGVGRDHDLLTCNAIGKDGANNYDKEVKSGRRDEAETMLNDPFVDRCFRQRV